MKFKSFAAAALVALSLSACEVAEEPDSFSQQGRTTEQVEEGGQAAKGSSEGTKEKKNTKPKWQRNMNKVKVGTSQKRVKKLLGKPEDTTASETSVPEMDEDTFEVTERTMTTDIWTYGSILKGETTWVLTFMDGKLESKTRM